MRVHLMYPDRDFDPDPDLPPYADDVLTDIQLGPVLTAMAAGDELKRSVARTAVVTGCDTPDLIRYRHDVLTDCADNRGTVTELYELAGNVLADREHIHHSSWAISADNKLGLSVSVLDACLPHFHRLHDLAEASAPYFSSSGFRRMFAGLREELDTAYLADIEDHLKRLRFRNGMLLSAALGEGNTGVDFVLRVPDLAKRSWFRRVPLRPPTRSYTIPDRDQASFNALSELRNRAVTAAATAASESVNHVIDFFTVLRHELAFYLACLNLADALAALGQDVCLPVVDAAGLSRHTATQLYDAGLALDSRRPAVPSDLDTQGAPLVLITGANRGGKSTFLRAIGIAALLMRCGCYVPASAYQAPLFPSIHSHFRREEDETLASGKLDEELTRMRALTNEVSPGSLVLSNESFSSTNEREGSQIAEDVLHALAESGVHVVMVTHLYELAESLRTAPVEVTFLRAQRGDRGERPFRILPGQPKPTSHAMDLYERIFAPAKHGG